MMKFLSKRRAVILACALLLLLALKYFWSLAKFPGVPFGYDAGIYRYLFLKHAEAFPPFSMASMPPWAASHPLGLFFFSTILLRLGIPVDCLIGWMWNLFPVVLSGVFASVFARRNGSSVGLSLLLICLLSTVQYQGFLMIYWKVFVAFLWCILAFSAFERKSKYWVLFGMMVVATHQQIGLIFALATLSSILSHTHDRKAFWKRVCEWTSALFLGALWYLPNGTHALLDVLPLLAASSLSLLTLGVLVFAIGIIAAVTFFPRHGHSILLALCGVLGALLLLLPLTGIAPAFLDRFLQGGSNTPGAFLTIPEYLEVSLPLLLLGIVGVLRCSKKEKGSVWQWAVLWCALAVLSMFFFYRRFILPLDFFLLPFAALALEQLWTSRDKKLQLLAVVAVFAQSSLLFGSLRSLDPHVDRSMLDQFAGLASVVEPQSEVIVLDIMAPWVLGYLPDSAVSGPGIFDSKPLAAWEALLYGSGADRSAFIASYKVGTYFYATDVFRSYYPSEVQTLFAHPCLRSLPTIGLYRSVCGNRAQ